MIADYSVLIRVPATVGSFGGALNCAALALDASLNVKVSPRLDGHVSIRYFGENGERVPRDRSNLVVRALQAALHLKQREFTGADFEIYSSIPVGVGLGSSTAAVLAGLMAADRLFRLSLEEKTLFELASIYESRRDNMRAAWVGGFVACGQDGTSIADSRAGVSDEFILSVVIPEALPSPRAKAAGGERPSPVRQDILLDSRGAAEFAEYFHRHGLAKVFQFQPPSASAYEKTVPGLEEVLAIRRRGVLGLFVCGSGPAVGILAEEDRAGAIEAVRECFARHEIASRAIEFRPANVGARDWKEVHPSKSFAAGGLRGSLPKSSLIPI